MSFNDIKDDTECYVPNKITVGLFSEYAFITCKFKNEKWIGPTIFERLCGYKPHLQRDSCKQLKKLISNAVYELSNDPVEGFELEDPNDDPYGMNTAYGARGDVVLRDPRGFKIAMPEAYFWIMLKSCNYNIKDRTIAGKFSYIWAANTNRFMLLESESASFKKWKELSANILKFVDAIKYLGAKDLKLGLTYNTKHGEKWMYLGKHDTYSAACHLEALDNPTVRYSDCMLDKFRTDRDDLTSTGKYVFYNVGISINEHGIYSSPNMKSTTDMPYVTRSSLSKLLVSEVPTSEILNVKMYDSMLQCTYDNVKADMESSLFFHMIDFSRCNTSLEPLDFNVFNFEYDKHKLLLNFYPFYGYDKSYYIDTYKYGKVFIDESIDYGSGYNASKKSYSTVYKVYGYSPTNTRHWNSYYNQPLAVFDDSSMEELYTDLKPCVSVFYLDNGNKVSQFAARCLLPILYRNSY